MTSEAAVFPVVSVISNNVHCSCPFYKENSTRVLYNLLTSVLFENVWLCQMGSSAYTNYSFHQLINISSAADFSLLDNIFVTQGSSAKVQFVDNSAIMGLYLKHLSRNCLRF
ncbi:hypothetical protein DFH08DRAFT_801616 [Mycena albidolilacea]|uniref:Uncharacterized protein n=1 Tax=Mycena albidolilacea TaxID=1033008 RepID=A0AAD6YWD6_9AGAR|nr:hypothetical protein DFH08DRAFT_828373 [Mycena albidolilacea]KAJ7302036.1 hypothetical protein DFH08DRAFT_827034 [Mycena albidolilacea]KAJ7359856.1 hypothetical protein DFH08DRAFT_801616 [Mycena albidolilacea]